MGSPHEFRHARGVKIHRRELSVRAFSVTVLTTFLAPVGDLATRPSPRVYSLRPQRYRGKTSEQRVTVEHVHVYAGGQAVVGAVSGAPMRPARAQQGEGGDGDI